MVTYLDAIIAAHRRVAAAAARDEAALEAAAAAAPPARGFAAALGAAGELAVIAEIKRRSPSKGPLAPELDPASLAAAYAAGGAACLSVLTDKDFFGGSPADLAAARAVVDLPVLRKDFTVADADCLEARAMGADAVLLIVAALDDGELRRFVRLAGRLGLDALVEVHDEAELARALDAGATMVGVNQRDLHTFAVDPERAVRVGEAIPDGVVRVAESGVRSPEDLGRLAGAGFHAVLVGEALVTAADPVGALRSLRAGLPGGDRGPVRASPSA